MKKTLVSLAAVAALTTGAMAADKGVDLTVTGQAVAYYETKATDAAGDDGLTSKANSNFSTAVQLNVGGDLGNGFTLGSQVSYLDDLGFDNQFTVGDKQEIGTTSTTTDELALTQINVTKKIGNTSVKLGRQELAKSVSPLAFSEGWNVLKNTFDAAVVVNTDLPDTTLVGAYVGGANSSVALDTIAQVDVAMLTVVNKSLPMTAVTGTYYNTNSDTRLWLDAKVAGKDLPLGLSVGLQYGSFSSDAAGSEDTSALGVKVALKPMSNVTVKAAYSSVDEGTIAAQNIAAIKTPLHTQMIYNQNFIKSDADAIVVGGSYNMGDAGKIIANYCMSTYNASTTENEYTELDLIYKVKSGGVTYWASAMLRDIDGFADNKVRLWARLGF